MEDAYHLRMVRSKLVHQHWVVHVEALAQVRLKEEPRELLVFRVPAVDDELHAGQLQQPRASFLARMGDTVLQTGVEARVRSGLVWFCF